ncbi:NAD-dependent epimerase/dehydratase family protein [Aminobacter aganoensis]|uniref:NAD-dependent epimerase/dehydratase family protein n=1 Tax=Aminobacter TaxID=31988 RepID=UPI0006FA2A90|nr:NAD(P)-dependent oxidoreductase [Aminobacter sp. DSM 101952]KQU74508.1 NAD-dependent dehydratase [Aminobacter sp. DSM 101952]
MRGAEKTVLVTGGAGLLGNAVRTLLEERGTEVIAVDRIDVTGDGRPLTVCDITDIHRLHAVVVGRDIGGIVHCGGFSGPMVERANPNGMVQVNVVGTANVLELARIHSVQRFVFCSSTSAFGNTESENGQTPEPVPEDVALWPSSVYGASKVAGEQLVSTYAQQYGLDGVSLRISWVYGPRRTTDCAIRTMIEDALASRPTHLPFGRNFPRQYIHVDDAARALVSALDKPSLPRRTYTVTGGTFLTLGEIGDMVARVLPNAEINLGPGSDPVDDVQGRFDISAVERDLGFAPAIGLEDGIRSYAAWLSAHASGHLERTSN